MTIREVFENVGDFFSSAWDWFLDIDILELAGSAYILILKAIFIIVIFFMLIAMNKLRKFLLRPLYKNHPIAMIKMTRTIFYVFILCLIIGPIHFSVYILYGVHNEILGMATLIVFLSSLFMAFALQPPDNFDSDDLTLKKYEETFK